MSLNPGATSSLDGNESALAALAKLASKSPIKEIFEALGSDSDLHLVGGLVRDTLLGGSNADIDLASKLTPEDAAAKLSNAGLKVIKTGLQHGTVTIVVNNTNIELTTFRKPAPHGVNEYSESIEIDLSGRDFTINAIAYSLNQKQLIDPYEGINDLKNTSLKSVGDAGSRYQEDPLRILRMIRFGPASDYQVEERTRLAAVAAANTLDSISPERIRDELFKILMLDGASKAFRFMRDNQILKHVLPEMLPSVDFEQNKFHMHDVFEHTLWVIDRAPKDLIVRLGALFHDLGKPHTLSVGDDGERHFYKHELSSGNIAKDTLLRLRCSNKLIREVKTIVRLHMRPLDCGPAGVRRIIRDTEDYFDNWRKLKLADSPPLIPEEEYAVIIDNFDQMVETERNREVGSPFKNLEIGGDDLIELGAKPGPLIGTVLKELHELVLDKPDLNTKPQLLELARTRINQTRQS